MAGRCRIAIGGNFDESSADSFPALLDFLKAQDFGDKLVKVELQADRPHRRRRRPKGIIPLIPVGATAQAAERHLHDVGRRRARGAACDCCDTLDDKMSFLREETQRHGFPTHDGVHEAGRATCTCTHAHTIGPDGSLYACPGFTGQPALSTGHIDDRRDSWRESALEKFERLHPWKECGDCASSRPVRGDAWRHRITSLAT